MASLIKLISLSFLILKTYSQVTTCTAEMRGKMCTQEYVGVCGLFNQTIQCIKAPCGQTYGNICTACSDEKVATVTMGACDSNIANSTSIVYPYSCLDTDRNKTCSAVDNSTVCSWFNSTIKCSQPPCTSTSTNLCSACNNPGVEKVTSGKCEREMILLDGTYIKYAIGFIMLLALIL